MDLDLRHQEKPTSFKALWLKDQFDKIRLVMGPEEISNKEIQEKLLEVYEKRYLSYGRLFNNTDNSVKRITQEDFINLFITNPYILSGYATFYANQDDAENISSRALEFILNSRKKYKKQMLNAPHGSNEYMYYKVMQLTYKLIANSYYGILGEHNSAFYNSYVQNSITMSGQDLITSSIIGMECFLSNNVPFDDTDAILQFIKNIISENYKLNILEYTDSDISCEMLKEYLISHTRPEAKSSIDIEILDTTIKKLSQEQIRKIYYKNQILDICKNKWFQDKLKAMTQYYYEEEPAKEMRADLKEFKTAIIEFCNYNYLFEDRYKRAMKDKRHSITTIDTDSNFINLNKYVVAVMDWFDLDKSDEIKKMTVFNIFMDIITDVLKRMFWKMTTNMGLIDSHKEIIAMKPEFVYKRILLTRNKKNYAGIITGELGKLLDEPTLDMKGMSIRKSNVPKTLRSAFTNILVEKVLKPEKINIKEILNCYDDLEKDIHDSLARGEVVYSLPRALGLQETYKTPDRIEGFRGALTWNALEPGEEVVLPDKVNMIKLIPITDPEDPRLDPLKSAYPEKYQRLLDVVFNINKTAAVDISKFGFSTISFPKTVSKIPDYLISFIDYSSMVANNMSNGYIILESLGINCEAVGTVNHKSNIIEI